MRLCVVKLNTVTSFSDFIELSVGLKQGICSSILYPMFVEDLEIYLHDRYNNGQNSCLVPDKAPPSVIIA